MSAAWVSFTSIYVPLFETEQGEGLLIELDTLERRVYPAKYGHKYGVHYLL